MVMQAVFFDVGGTLLRPRPDVAHTFTQVAHARGHEVELAQVQRCIPAMDAFYEEEYRRDGDFWCSPEGSVEIWLDQYRLLCRLLGLADDAEGMARQVHAAFRHGDHWAVFPDAWGCLRALRGRGLVLAAVSNWDAGLEVLFEDLGLAPLFDAVVSSAAVGCRKPDPAIFRIACRRLDLRPELCVHVGDRPDADGDGAAAAGLRPLIIDRAGALEDCPYERIASLEEVPGLLA